MIQYVWGGAQDFAFIARFQVILILLFNRTHLKTTVLEFAALFVSHHMSTFPIYIGMAAASSHSMSFWSDGHPLAKWLKRQQSAEFLYMRMFFVLM